MRALAARVDQRDPSRLKATEKRRASEAVKDLNTALQSVVERVAYGNITDPKQLQEVVDEELERYESLASNKHDAWLMDTVRRSILFSEQLLKTAGVKAVAAGLGPRGIPQKLSDALVINVHNQIGSLTASVKAKVSAALIEGVEAGEGARPLAKRVSEATGMERSRAELIARTETMRAYNEVSQDQFERYGVEKVEWLAAMDERTCPVCGKHHGREFPINDHPEIPAHPNCRCILLPVIEEAA